MSLAITHRELRLASRRWATYNGRMMVALFTTFWVGMILYGLSKTGVRVTTLPVFAGMVNILTIACLVSGASQTIDSIASERRDDTLGLLFLTPLGVGQILWGKLMTGSLTSVLSLLAAVPALTIPMVVGGVSGRDLVFALVALGNALMLSACLGLFLSCASREPRRILGPVIAASVLLTLNGPGIVSGLRARGQTELAWVVFWLSPSTPVQAVQSGTRMLRPLDFWGPLAVQLGCAAGLFLAGCWVLRRKVCERPSGRWREAWAERWRRWLLGSRAARLDWRNRQLDRNPCLWLFTRYRLAEWEPWVWVSISLLIWLGMWQLSGRTLSFLGVALLCASLTLHLGLKLSLLSLCAGRFFEERRNRTMEMIVSTPLTVGELLRGQWLALRHRFRGVLILVLGFDLVLVCGFWVAWTQSGQPIESHHYLAWWIYGARTVMLLADLAALAITATWGSLVGRTRQEASSHAANRILVWPSLLFYFGLPWLLGISWLRTTGSAFLFVGVWLVLGLAFDWFFGRAAYRRLVAEFRERASEPVLTVERTGWWGVLGARLGAWWGRRAEGRAAVS